jgi:hypothetical protein
MSRIRTARIWPVLSATAVLLAGCTSSGTPSTAPETSTSPTSPAESSPPPVATPAPRPATGACYRLDYDQALAPTTHARPVPCRAAHTATTYLVGTLDTVVQGHLLAVDSPRVQDQVAAACPSRLGRFLGATPAQLRLTSLRAVWFTPTLAQSDRGQDWYRCDVTAVAGPEELARLTDPVQGVLRTPVGRTRYGICGTAQPGTPTFERVICSRRHTWRAIATYDVRGRSYPGQAAVRAVAQRRCKSAAQVVATDSLDYQWGYDWPTREQWDAGQHYGLCWAPD